MNVLFLYDGSCRDLGATSRSFKVKICLKYWEVGVLDVVSIVVRCAQLSFDSLGLEIVVRKV